MPSPLFLSNNEIRRRFFSLQSLEDLADLLGIPTGSLAQFVFRTQLVYVTFDIPKKSGGQRSISSPSPYLKGVQRRLNYILSKVYQRKRATHGFTTKRSIVTNAREHVGKNWVLNIDLQDFFPSLHFGRVRGMFMARPYNLPNQVSTALARLTCKDGSLPQGAPTSPIISNMICRELDADLHRLARQFRCTYTRYADDITFSTNSREFPPEIASVGYSRVGPGLQLGDALVQVITSAGFAVNQEKNRLQYKTERQEVTGLRVNRFPNISRKYFQKTRAMIRAWETFGLKGAQSEYTRRYDLRYRTSAANPSVFSDVVRGRLEFIRMVKGEADTGFRTLANRLNRLDHTLIRPFPPNVPVDPDERWRHLFEVYSPMVYLLALKNGDDWSSGTAFAWGRRLLVTAGHCTDGAVSISPPMTDGYEFPPDQILRYETTDAFGEVRVDRKRDVAALITPDEVAVGSWPVRRSPLNPGEQVAAIGYPSMLGREPAVGIYVGLVESRRPHLGGEVMSVQVSIAMAGGLSGAPVIDRGGYLVGTVMELTMEDAAEDAAPRAFHHILPIEYLVDLTRGHF